MTGLSYLKTYNMAIIYDSTSTSTKVSGVPYTEHSTGHTVTTAENRILVVSCVNVSGSTITGVTWDGVAMTDAGLQCGSSYSMSTWYLLNPNSGTKTLEVTFSAGTVGDIITITSLSGATQAVEATTGISTTNTTVTGSMGIVVDDSFWYYFCR